MINIDKVTLQSDDITQDIVVDDEIDVVENVVANNPDLPVHIPYAGNTNPGIASFNTRDFIVEENGAVQLSKDVQGLVNDAEDAANRAEQSAIDADSSAAQAAQSALEAKNSATSASNSTASASEQAQIAIGAAEQAEEANTLAQSAKNDAEIARQGAEAARYQAAMSETNAKASEIAAEEAETNATNSEVNAKLYETNASASAQNAQHYAEQAKQIVDGLGSVYKPQGSIMYASLPNQPSENERGYVWNILDAFVTDDRFLEGAGIKCVAGANVACILSEDSYKYDILGSFIDLSNYVQKTDLFVDLGEKNIDESFPISSDVISALMTNKNLSIVITLPSVGVFTFSNFYLGNLEADKAGWYSFISIVNTDNPLMQQTIILSIYPETNTALLRGVGAEAQPAGNYALQTGNYPNMTVGKATDSDALGGKSYTEYALIDGTYADMSVGHATGANTAANDVEMNPIVSTYAKQNGTYAGLNVGYATRATRADNDGNGDRIADTYVKKVGTYPDLTVGFSNHASEADAATNDSDGNKISDTYAKKTDTFSKMYFDVLDVDSSFGTTTTMDELAAAMADNSFIDAYVGKDQYPLLIPNGVKNTGHFWGIKKDVNRATFYYSIRVNNAGTDTRYFVYDWNSYYSNNDPWEQVVTNSGAPEEDKTLPIYENSKFTWKWVFNAITDDYANISQSPAYVKWFRIPYNATRRLTIVYGKKDSAGSSALFENITFPTGAKFIVTPIVFTTYYGNSSDTGQIENMYGWVRGDKVTTSGFTARSYGGKSFVWLAIGYSET